MITRTARPAASVQAWTLASRQDTANGRLAAHAWVLGRFGRFLACKYRADEIRAMWLVSLPSPPRGVRTWAERRKVLAAALRESWPARHARRGRVISEWLSSCLRTGPPAGRSAVYDCTGGAVFSP